MLLASLFGILFRCSKLCGSGTRGSILIVAYQPGSVFNDFPVKPHKSPPIPSTNIKLRDPRRKLVCKIPSPGKNIPSLPSGPTNIRHLIDHLPCAVCL